MPNQSANTDTAISSDLPDDRSRPPMVIQALSWDLRTSPFQNLSTYVIGWSMVRRWNDDCVSMRL